LQQGIRQHKPTKPLEHGWPDKAAFLKHWRALREHHELPQGAAALLALASVLLKTVQKRAGVEKIRALSAYAAAACQVYTPVVCCHADELPGYLKHRRGTRGTGALGEVFGDKSNLGQSYFLTIQASEKEYRERCQKLAELRGFFQDHPAEWVAFLLFGESRLAVSTLSYKWHVKQQWTVGWLRSIRRRMEADLTPEREALFEAEAILPLDQGVSKALQAKRQAKRDALRQLLTPSQTHRQQRREQSRLPPELRIDQVSQTGVPNPPSFPEIPLSAFEQAGRTLLTQVQATLRRLQAHNRSLVATTTFLHKVELLVANASTVITILFRDTETPPLALGTPALDQKSQRLARVLHSRAKKYRSALAAILSLAVTLLPERAVYAHSPGVEQWLNADRCLTLPFSRRRQQYQDFVSGQSPQNPLHDHGQPLSLVMGSQYVVYRPGDAQVMTQLLRVHGYVDVVILDCSVPRLAANPLDGAAASPPARSAGRRESTGILLRIPASAKMRQILQQGVTVALLRLLPPRGPARTLQVDIIFEGTPNQFAATKHLACGPTGALTRYAAEIRQRLPEAFAPTNVLAFDVNRISPYILASSGESASASERLLSLPLLHLCAHYQAVGKQRAVLQQKRAYQEQQGASAQVRVLDRQIALLDQRRAALRKEAHVRCGVEVASQLALTGGVYCVTENLCGLSPHGARKALADAIHSMPDEPEPFQRALFNLAIADPDIPRKLIQLLPDGTSLKHVGCPCTDAPGQLKRLPGAWDWATCTQCGQVVNTHVNAAQRLEVRCLAILPQ